MSADDDLDLFEQLLVEAVRFAPRYPPEIYGRCVGCDLGPTGVMPVQKQVWCFCGFCGDEWNPKELNGMFDGVDDDVEVLREKFAILALFDVRDANVPALEMQRASLPAASLSLPAARRPKPHTLGVIVNPLIAPDGQPLENYAIRVRDRQRAADAAKSGRVLPPEPTAAELATWAETLRLEDPETRDRRARLIQQFGQYVGSRFVFPVSGAWLIAEEICERLEQGAPYTTFYPVLFRGEERKRRP